MSNTPIRLRKTVVPVSYGIEIEGRNSLLRSYVGTHKGFFYITTDGSLEYRDSVEVVSQPLPVRMLVRCLTSFARKYGKVYPEHSAGIHIHVTRTPKTERRLKEFYTFLYNNRSCSFRHLFGRVENYYARWSTEPDLVFQGHERYSAVNFRNLNTIEVRAFGNNLVVTNGIEAGIMYLQRLDYILNSKKEIGFDLIERAIYLFPIGELE